MFNELAIEQREEEESDNIGSDKSTI